MKNRLSQKLKYLKWTCFIPTCTDTPADDGTSRNQLQTRQKLGASSLWAKFNGGRVTGPLLEQWAQIRPRPCVLLDQRPISKHASRRNGVAGGIGWRWPSSGVVPLFLKTRPCSVVCARPAMDLFSSKKNFLNFAIISRFTDKLCN